MSDEMMVQNQRPSAGKYLLAGAAVGAAAGAAQPWVNKKAKYSSFDDIIKEKEDSFNKAKEKADGDAKDAYTKISDEKGKYQTKVKEIEDEMKTYRKDNGKWADELGTKGEDWEKAVNDTVEARKNVIEDIKAKIKSGEIEVSGLKKEDAAKAEDKVLEEKAEAYFKENESKLADDSSKVKDTAKKLKEAKEAETKAKGELDALAKEKGKPAERTLNEEAKKGLEAIEKKLGTAKEEAWKAVKDEAAKIKTPRRVMNGIIGAVVFALGALLFRPKAKDDV